jgi:3-hydroxyisobutyrate dehydrogenase-like beta-hydroxyacid dehydrogenase
MTLNLAKAGHTVTGLDLSAASLEALEQAAGRRAATAS